MFRPSKVLKIKSLRIKVGDSNLLVEEPIYDFLPSTLTKYMY